MNVYIADTTVASTGNQTFLTPGVTNIKKVNFTISAVGTTYPMAEALCHFSYGFVAYVDDGTGTYVYRQKAHSVMDGGLSRLANAYCLTHYDLNAGLTYRRISASIVSFGTGQFTLNFDRADTNYKIQIEVIGD